MDLLVFLLAYADENYITYIFLLVAAVVSLLFIGPEFSPGHWYFVFFSEGLRI